LIITAQQGVSPFFYFATEVISQDPLMLMLLRKKGGGEEIEES